MFVNKNRECVFSDRLLEVFNTSLSKMKALKADVVKFVDFGHFDVLVDENVATCSGEVEYYYLYNWNFTQPCTRNDIDVYVV